VASRALLVSCSAYSWTLKMKATFPLKRRLTFKGLHGVISQEIELFITTAVRTSNPTTMGFDGHEETKNPSYVTKYF
jgi:hypothetical protein